MTTLENIGNSDYVMKTDIDYYFTPQMNKASGNCLFESLSQSVYGNMTKQAFIRKLVCDFRKNITDFSPTNSLDFRVKEFLEADVSDFTICNNKEYALALDVLIAAVVLQKNIVLFTDKENKNNSEHEKVYNVEKFEYDINVDTIYVLFRPFNDNSDYEPNHFESLKLNKIKKLVTPRVEKNTLKSKKVLENEDYEFALQLAKIEKMEEEHRKSQELADEKYARSLGGKRKRYTTRRKIKNKNKRRTIRR